MLLHIGHQALRRGEALGAEEQQMLQKMRQPRPVGGYVMTAHGHSDASCAAREPWDMAHGQRQTIAGGQA